MLLSYQYPIQVNKDINGRSHMQEVSGIMDENEQAIIQKIRRHKHPDHALRVVSNIILTVLAESRAVAKPVISANLAKNRYGEALRPSFREEPDAKD